MKIRTDFVTNSSSSSFTIVVALQDKKGNEFSFRESPYEFDINAGGECSFNANLGNLLIDNVVDEIKKYRDIEYKLEAVDQKGRNARIENVSVGDPVSLVKIAGQTRYRRGWNTVYRYGWDTVDYAIDVQSAEGSLGILPGEALEVIRDAFEGDSIVLKATVSSVTPLSKRRRNAKYALISIVIDAEKKYEGQIFAIDNVSKLAQFLMDSVSDNYEPWEDEDEAEEDSMGDQESGDAFEQRIAERKRKFVEEVSEQVPNVDDIAKITVHREYSACGEYADLIPDNDWTLIDLAEKVNDATGEAREKALDEMLEYIRTPDSDRNGEHFGIGYDIYYVWNGNKKELLKLAKRLCSNRGASICEGREHDEVDFVEGTVKSYAEFDLR